MKKLVFGGLASLLFLLLFPLLMLGAVLGGNGNSSVAACGGTFEGGMLPFSGKVQYTQGPFGQFSHQNMYAWDFASFGQEHIPIVANAEGELETGVDPSPYGLGNYIKIHTTIDEVAYIFLYGHLHEFIAQNGPIKKGTEIAKMGTTGNSTGVHLHFEVRDATNKNIDGTKFVFGTSQPANVGSTLDGVKAESGDSSAGSACSGGVGTLVGNSNAEKIWNFLVNEHHFTKEAAAGVIGNLMQESGCDPKSRQSPGPGRGIMQWTESERWASMIAWAKDKDPWLLETQLEWMVKELHDYGVYDKLKTISSVTAAADYFEHEMERAGIPAMANRYKYAYDALAQFGG